MIIKTHVEKREGVKDEDYVNTPVTNRMDMMIDVRNGIMKDKSKTIGVVTNAVTQGDKVELTIALWTQAGQLQGEWLMRADGKHEPISFSIGLK